MKCPVFWFKNRQLNRLIGTILNRFWFDVMLKSIWFSKWTKSMETLFSRSCQETKFIISCICYLYMQVRTVYTDCPRQWLVIGVDQSEVSTKWISFKFDFYCAVNYSVLSWDCSGLGFFKPIWSSFEDSGGHWLVGETLLGTRVYGSRLQYEWRYFQSFLLRWNYLQNNRTGSGKIWSIHFRSFRCKLCEMNRDISRKFSETIFLDGN